ncbi:unnamed protein product [Thelazia callipaeda]|uniref:Conserved oligomeric Golgi complex subunit 3 n=1 Tax=Thelazia callipaeda TaxID=103827 RepID=A0A0N5CX49_THECL|nr:unnamed protein product [Thelazia callipaeda]
MWLWRLEILWFVIGLTLFNAGSIMVRGTDEADGVVEEISANPDEDVSSVSDDKVAETEVDPILKPSPDAHVAFIFVHPENSKNLPGGRRVEFLMGFQNRGDKDFIIRFCETSLRYPQDFNYHIQNFTTMHYNRVVPAKQEATFGYALYPPDQFAGRSLGLVVELQYDDQDGKAFRSAVFNETVMIIEDESSFNTETGFLYIIFAAVVVLILLAGQHFLSKLTRKHGMAKSRQTQQIEVGTSNKDEVDFEWIPREVLNHSKNFRFFDKSRQSQDHLDNGNKHSEWINQIICLFVLGSFKAMDFQSKNIKQLVSDEFQGVENKMHFFGEMHTKTMALLSSKVANYGLPNVDDATTSQTEENKNANTEELAVSNMNASALLSCLSDLYEAEKKSVVDGFVEENAEINLLYNCKKTMDQLKECYDKCIELVNELRDNYEMVTERTSSLHNACDQMMAYQTQIAAGAEQIRANLYYYTQCESIMKKLNNEKFAITGQVFTQILSTIDECLKFLRSHIHYKESAVHISKYEQCLSKAMTVIKMGVIADLEASHSAVKDKNMQLDVDIHQNAYADDDTFALLYGVFAARANSVRSALSVAERHFRDVAAFQLMVSDCQQVYFTIRNQMLEPVIRSTITDLMSKHGSSSCSFTRTGCSFLLRLCDDEFRLYKQFFSTNDEEGSGSRSVSASVVSSPHASVLAPFLSSTTSFDDFIESLCHIFYDILRPIVIHNPHLETLTELCTILKVEMIEERCGLMQSMMSVKQLMGEADSGSVLLNNSDEYVSNSRNGFVRIMSELVGDVAERIVYRACLFAQSDIISFVPSSGDLAYPEKLEMIREIEREHSLKKDDANSNSSISAIDLHCLWYPTVRRTVLCLSKLFRCLEQSVFQSIARELLSACCQSLENAAEQIRNSSLEKFSRSRRSLDAELFIVKHLLILREQTSPYRVVVSPGSSFSDAIPVRDYSLDFSKYKNSASQLFQDSRRWFELTSNNIFLEFLLKVPLAVTEVTGDSRRIIDSQLKTHCHSLINIAGDMIILEFANYIAEAEKMVTASNSDLSKNDFLKANNMQDFVGQANKNLTHLWPEIKKCINLYIGMKETEDVLLQPVKKRIIDVFTRAGVVADKLYDEEQKQIAGLPTQEHIWLLINA